MNSNHSDIIIGAGLSGIGAILSRNPDKTYLILEAEPKLVAPGVYFNIQVFDPIRYTPLAIP
jgi:hypothetical protein